MTPGTMRIGFTSIYSWRPHVEHLAFLARMVEKAGHEAHFLTCDADLDNCYTRELRSRPAWQECLQCRVGGIRSYTARNVSSIGQMMKVSAADMQPAPIEWARSSASTLGRFESDTDYASAEFQSRVERLYPTVQTSYVAARRWIESRQLDAVCVFNGRMDATRAIFEAAKSLGVRVVSVERTWFGDGLQLYPDEHCLGLQSLHRLMREWRDRPLTHAQAIRAASYAARRFLRLNQKEWRAYNVDAKIGTWPIAGARRRVLLIPSSRNEVWGHPDWASAWGDALVAYDAIIERLQLAPEDLVLRCHPNWGERIGVAGGEKSERHYSQWALQRGIHTIASRDSASTLGLMEQCDALVVANGSAVLEAGMLGKQVIAVAPSFFNDAGIRDDATSPAALQTLRMHADLSEPERHAEQRRLQRQTLRFAYTMVHRVPQYTEAVKADATTRFRYDFDADPKRFIELLRSGVLRADDETHASDAHDEDGVLARVTARDWQGLLDALEPHELALQPLNRRFPFQPLDAIRQRMPVGDR
ncbi:hypothetical protein [Variovorax sp. WS11]|uniref:hypothetical protein n=2 Tax=Variovorax sp. WS11 TaxID=1105204 RepID=UPI0011B287AB|nr:hypothetical protein [Variovorax sp. WS11]NDZ13437.1 hypothetical protein [Variovorax sp. WS11]